MEDKRSFTIVSVNDRRRSKGDANEGGRFISYTPSGAARKAGSHICRATAIRGQCTLKLCIQETTRGSSHKMYFYIVKRVVDTRKVIHDGKAVVHKYKTIAKKDHSHAVVKASPKAKAGKKLLSGGMPASYIQQMRAQQKLQSLLF